jgi:dTDP-4-dehydrorhamnose reductase
MRIAVFGRTGQVARELALLDGVACLGREVADFADPDAVRRAAEGVAADAIVNAVAYTAVDRAESEEDLARAVNATAVGALAEVAAARGLPLVHISTDYVFDGSGDRPWCPDDPVGPLGAYGRTKLEGEEAVRAAGGTHAILRTSWVFSAHGANFVRTMLRLGAERDSLRIVADQIGGPTPARAIAAACAEIAGALARDPGLKGTYHFAGAPDTSWAGFARAIFDVAGLTVAVEEIASADYPTPAARPKNSRLDCTATEVAFGIARPDWRSALPGVVAALREG